MAHFRTLLYALATTTILAATVASAKEPEDARGAGPVDSDRLRSALARAVPQLQAGMAGSAEERQCFTCHNQALPVIAIRYAEPFAATIDRKVFDAQVEHTRAHLKRGQERYKQGKGQGGQVLTAGYALWMLDVADQKPDETTTAVANYLLQYQRKNPFWRHTGRRPPSSGSDFTATYVALRGLRTYADPATEDDVQERFTEVRQWLLKTPPKDTEDRVFQLLGLHITEAPEEAIRERAQVLLRQQQNDGGWAQLESMSSDAYATGSVLFALLESEQVQPQSPEVQRGLRFLLDSQHANGAWHVVTRADGFQEYYESGFPFGEDQFISISATAWAVAAIARSMP